MSSDVLEWSDSCETDEEDENVVIQESNVRYGKVTANVDPSPAYDMVQAIKDLFEYKCIPK